MKELKYNNTVKVRISFSFYSVYFKLIILYILTGKDDSYSDNRKGLLHRGKPLSASLFRSISNFTFADYYLLFGTFFFYPPSPKEGFTPRIFYPSR